MRFSVAIFAISAVIVGVSASSLNRRQLPACATACIEKADFDGCQPTDNLCLCKSQKFISSSTTCIVSTCTGSDLTNAESIAQQECAAVGVTLTSTPASTGTSAAASSTPTSPSTASTTGSASGAASSSKSSAATSPSASPSTKSNGAYSNGMNVLTGIAAYGFVALAL